MLWGGLQLWDHIGFPIPFKKRFQIFKNSWEMNVAASPPCTILNERSRPCESFGVRQSRVQVYSHSLPDTWLSSRGSWERITTLSPRAVARIPGDVLCKVSLGLCKGCPSCHLCHVIKVFQKYNDCKPFRRKEFSTVRQD